jgi:acyl-CoA dehydrogenase
MSYRFNEERRRIQELIRRIAAERVRPRAMEIDATAEYPQDMFDLLRELGLFTLPFPPEYGGSGSLVAACLAIEEFGRVCYNTAYLLLLQWVPFGALLAGGDEAQKRRFLPGLASGELRGAISLTEPQSGSDVVGIRTRALRARRLPSYQIEDLVHQRAGGRFHIGRGQDRRRHCQPVYCRARPPRFSDRA